MRQETMGSDPDEDLIPTAIVIKNVPFAIKKEQLVQIMTEMGLPLPYAFNYHFDTASFGVWPLPTSPILMRLPPSSRL